MKIAGSGFSEKTTGMPHVNISCWPFCLLMQMGLTLKIAASMGVTIVRPWPSGKKVKVASDQTKFNVTFGNVFHFHSILYSPLQICTYMVTAQHMMISMWWCVATVARWWSLKPLRSTARGDMVLSQRCAASHLLWLHSSDLALASLSRIFPPLERGRRMVDVMKPVSPPQQRYLSISTGLPRPKRRLRGTVCIL